jgi:hypothetical protein
MDGMRCAVPLALAALDTVFSVGPDIYVECVVAGVHGYHNLLTSVAIVNTAIPRAIHPVSRANR